MKLCYFLGKICQNQGGRDTHGGKGCEFERGGGNLIHLQFKNLYLHTPLHLQN